MRQFKWLQQNGMDGVMLQRFTSELSSTNMFAERNQVAQNVMSAAASTGRTFNIMYDTAGQNPSTLVETVEKDWEYLVDSGKLTESSRYLRQNGLPVVSLYGFDVKTHPGTPTDLRELLTFFKHNANPAYRAYLIGGVSKDWRTNKTWASALGGFDAISPWMVGRFNSLSRADKYKSTTAAELQYAQAHGQKFLAGIFPGFSHYNRKGNQLNKIPRLGGRFLWEQAYNDVSLGVTSLYGAMLDEYNEGTALLPMAATAAYWPSGMKMVPLETDGYTKLPSDWYLRVGGEITKMVAGKIPPTPELPITPH